MIKVREVMAEGFLPQERSWRAQGRDEAKPSQQDTVTISEEGRKLRVHGHVMASISGDGVKKGG